MVAHDQNTERLIKEISAQQHCSGFPYFQGRNLSTSSQWIRRPLQSTLLTPVHERLPTCARCTVSEAPVYTLHWSDIHHFHFLFLHPLTNKNDGGRIADWLPVRSNGSTSFFSLSVSSSSPTAFGFVAVGLELWRPLRSSTDNNRLTPNWAVQEPQKTSSHAPWQLKLFWEPHEHWSWIHAAQVLKPEESRQTCVKGHRLVSFIVAGRKHTIGSSQSC